MLWLTEFQICQEGQMSGVSQKPDSERGSGFESQVSNPVSISKKSGNPEKNESHAEGKTESEETTEFSDIFEKTSASSSGDYVDVSTTPDREAPPPATKGKDKTVYSCRAKSFHLVLNEKTLEHETDVISYLKMHAPVDYFLCRKGKNKKGRMHAHVYVKYKGRTQISGRYLYGAHMAVARGSVQDNIEYIKDHHPIEVLEFGNMALAKRKKEDKWEAMIEQVKETGTVDKDERMYANHMNYWDRRIAEMKPKRTYEGKLKHKNAWIYGPPGTGKSRMARGMLPANTYFKQNNKWWDGYNDEKAVILEDIDPERCKQLTHHMKVWADRYPFTAEIKGGAMQINPLYNLIVTSNYSIDECFEGVDRDAIKRRFCEWELK